MSTIGQFTKTRDGYSGEIRTLAFIIPVVLLPADKRTDKSPDYRIMCRNVEVGAAWEKTADNGNEYVSLKLDDPSFPAPLFVNLVKTETGFEAIWSRSRN